jgi:DNA-binding NarL/FixJ family response regulator
MDFQLKVFLIDDHQMFREGVRSRLEREPDIEVVGEASSGEEALELLQEIEPDVALVDIRLQGMSGIELTRRLRERRPDLKLLVLTGYDFDQYVKTLVRVGIDGYLLKDSPQEALLEALRDIAGGGVALPPNIASKVVRGYSSTSSSGYRDTGQGAETLTVRELDVLELLFHGYRNAEIASRLSISVRTVEVHVRNVMSKMGAQSRTDAVRLALDRGLIR